MKVNTLKKNEKECLNCGAKMVAVNNFVELPDFCPDCTTTPLEKFWDKLQREKETPLREHMSKYELAQLATKKHKETITAIQKLDNTIPEFSAQMKKMELVELIKAKLEFEAIFETINEVLQETDSMINKIKEGAIN